MVLIRAPAYTLVMRFTEGDYNYMYLFLYVFKECLVGIYGLQMV